MAELRRCGLAKCGDDQANYSYPSYYIAIQNNNTRQLRIRESRDEYVQIIATTLQTFTYGEKILGQINPLCMQSEVVLAQ
jgi:hypothetical protein